MPLCGVSIQNSVNLVQMSSSEPSQYRNPLFFDQADEQSYYVLRRLFSRAIKHKANKIEFNLLDDPTVVTCTLQLARKEAFAIELSPEKVVAALLRRTELTLSNEASFQGRCHLEMPNFSLDMDLLYYDRYKKSDGRLGRTLTLSNFVPDGAHTDPFWQNCNRTATEELDQILTSSSGLVLGTYLSETDKIIAQAALRRRYPKIHIVESIREFSADQENVNRIQDSLVLLSLDVRGVLPALKILETAPAQLRERVISVFSYARIPRICPFCSTNCDCDPESLKLLPKPLQATVTTLTYPRGCSVCDSKGYIGHLGVLSMVAPQLALQPIFQQPQYQTKELYSLLCESGFVSTFQCGLTQALDGDTTIEAVASCFKKGNEAVQLQRLQAAGRIVVEDPTNEAGDTDPLPYSPLRQKSRNGIGVRKFHSCILDVGQDFIADPDEILAEQKRLLFGVARTETSPASKRGTKIKFHSQVLELDEDLLEDTSELLAEQRRAIFGDIDSNQGSKPNGPRENSAHPYHSKILELSEEMRTINRALGKL